MPELRAKNVVDFWPIACIIGTVKRARQSNELNLRQAESRLIREAKKDEKVLDKIGAIWYPMSVER